MIRRMHERIKGFVTRLIQRVTNFHPKPPTVQGTKQFFVRVARGAYTKAFEFVRGCIQHWETIAIIILATVGLTALLCEIGWLMALSLPFWIEVEMVLPVLSTLLIWGLIRSAGWRRKRRAAVA